jgi:CDP-glucose 4,6-dehydratase
MLDSLSVYKGKKILVTGHTGFKGTWLTRVLALAGAEVSGLALAPETGSLFSRIENLGMGDSTILDIRNRENVENYFKANKFDGVFHLAAQPLVLKSYQEPVETFYTNVMGTVHILDSITNSMASNWVVVVTTDKVYKNIEISEGYVEEDALGGKDPYSASKSASEMVVNAWRAISDYRNSQVLLCSVRAGNVIGGGDVAMDRLLPDLLRSFHQKSPAIIRNPNALRPWQHVLDPINGYLEVGKKLLCNDLIAPEYNFGPGSESKLNVEEMAKLACQIWGDNSSFVIKSEPTQPPESKLLWLSSVRAFQDLGWKNRLNAREAIEWTLGWEKSSINIGVLPALDKQVTDFFK